MPLYRHPALAVLKIGPQAAAFLKQYTTHLIDARQTAFLTREGKTVAVARISKISEDEALLVVGQAYVEKLLSHLGKYLGLSETKIQRLDWAAYLDPKAGAPPADGEFLAPEKAGRWILSPDKAQKAEWTEADYTRFRVEHGIPEQGIDFTDEMPLCIDSALVHFDKGCYLGQEIVARVHYRGKPPKKLAVKSQAECSPEELSGMTSKTELNGKVSGFVFISA